MADDQAVSEETRQFAKYIAMVVRNEMEEFHEHLTDDEMKDEDQADAAVAAIDTVPFAAERDACRDGRSQRVGTGPNSARELTRRPGGSGPLQ